MILELLVCRVHTRGCFSRTDQEQDHRTVHQTRRNHNNYYNNNVQGGKPLTIVPPAIGHIQQNNWLVRQVLTHPTKQFVLLGGCVGLTVAPLMLNVDIKEPSQCDLSPNELP